MRDMQQLVRIGSARVNVAIATFGSGSRHQVLQAGHVHLQLPGYHKLIEDRKQPPSGFSGSVSLRCDSWKLDFGIFYTKPNPSTCS
jgi:hypothetical protein